MTTQNDSKPELICINCTHDESQHMPSADRLCTACHGLEQLCRGFDNGFKTPNEPHSTAEQIEQIFTDLILGTEAKLTEIGWERYFENEKIAKAKLLQIMADERIDELERTVEICNGVIESWSKHAYSMESMVNDRLVYEKHPKADLDKRNDDVTDRRAILLTSAIPKHLNERISTLKSSRAETDHD